jgi:hypothetical protein
MPLVVELEHGVDRGEPGAEHQHAIGRRDLLEPFRGPWAPQVARIAGW